MSAYRGYRFGDFTLDMKRGTLLRGDVEVPLRPKSFAILQTLVQRHGELVTKDELLDRVWGRTVVTPGAITQCLIDVRRAVGDDTQEIIRTLPRRGYIFTSHVVALHDAPADVAEGGSVLAAAQAAAAPEAASPAELVAHAAGETPRAHATLHRAVRLGAAAVLALLLAGAVVYWAAVRDARQGDAATAATPAIAVLPFTDMSAGQDQQHFSDGLAEEVLNLLAQVPGLRVTARTSSFAFREQNVDIATVAERLNVTHVLEGSVRRSGDRVRVTAQLIDAATSLHLWSRTYDGNLGDVIELQGDIARQVAAALRVALVPNGARDAPVSPEAFEHFLRAKFFFQRRAPGDIDRAERHYRAALDIEPGFARAWAGLAGVHWIRVTDGTTPAEVGLERQRDAAQRALAIDSANTEAHVRLATYFYMTGDRSRARDHWERALELDPDHPLVLGRRVQAAIMAGQWDEAIQLQRRAAAADPLSVVAHQNLSEMLLLAGRYDEAAAASRRTAEINPTYVPEALANSLILRRRYEEAHALVDSWPAGPLRSKQLALIYAGTGRVAESDRALAELEAGCDENRCALDLAEVYAQRGEIDKAFGRLEAITRLRREQRPGLAALSPYLQPLHADPRWAVQRDALLGF